MNQVSDCYVFNDKYSSWIANGIFQEIDEADIIKLIELNHSNKKLELDGLLLIACWKSTEKVIKKLLELGANKDAKSKIGTTPIMFLAQRDWLEMVEMVEYFIKIEADLLFRSSNGTDLFGFSGRKTRDYFLKKLCKDAKEQNELTKKNTELSEKNTELLITNKDLSEKNTQLTTANKDLLEKHTELPIANKDLSEKNTRLMEKNTELLVANKDLLEKNTDLAKKNTELSEKNTELLIANKDLLEKNTELTTANKDLLEKNTELSENKKDSPSVHQYIEMKNTELDILRQKCKCEESLKENKNLLEKNIELEKKIKDLQDRLNGIMEPVTTIYNRTSILNQIICNNEGNEMLEKSYNLIKQLSQ